MTGSVLTSDPPEAVLPSEALQEYVLYGLRKRGSKGKAAFDTARDLLAILNSLERIKGLATDLCTVQLNHGRDLAAALWARYGVKEVRGTVMHAFPTPYLERRE